MISSRYRFYITAVELFNTQAKLNKLRKKRAFPIWGKSLLNDT
ncbi:hypothetical protein EC2016001_1358 [Escherichia coli 201600.1]|nr:hypothetical protein EC2016001_1358 [Escherichia coli 201600.1]